MRALIENEVWALWSVVPFMACPSPRSFLTAKRKGPPGQVVSSVSTEICKQRLDEHLLRVSYL